MSVWPKFYVALRDKTDGTLHVAKEIHYFNEVIDGCKYEVPMIGTVNLRTATVVLTRLREFFEKFEYVYQ